MEQKVRGRLLTGSALVALVGAIVTVVYFFQPWRSCDYEDTSAGCAMLPVDATVMAVSAVVTLVAVGVFVLALLVKERTAVR
ncbi:hypothetical protein [Microbacterium memoriense]|uniref:Uncharacterized protein n=1 Tax=Microbacterium memoriense TaxID=2978350 RepID=A0ABT2PEQ9_9MICO|nr:hypothetical protein [Microbacterium memoriense]MCT9002353.1 hypothetical protein [Microbacterium memoriense]